MDKGADTAVRDRPASTLPRPRPRHRIAVVDVMSTHPVTVTPGTGFKRMASLMHANRISGLPVVDPGGHPVGVVSETDLLAKERRPSMPRLTWLHPGRTMEHVRSRGTTAEEVMTSPAVTVTLHTGLVVAARRLDEHGVRRLLVVDDDGRLAGVVTRHDLLRAFLRPDAEILRDVEGIVRRWALVGSARIVTSVDEGIVTLSGTPDTAEEIEALTELIGTVDGVVDVVDASAPADGE